MIELLIDAQLPTLNEYTVANRSHWSKGAAFKKQVERLIGGYIMLSIAQKKLRSIKKPCEIFIEWHEGTMRRDVDNIQSAQKFILDALQAYKIIANDNRKHVKQVHHIIVDDVRDYVVVRFEEEEQ